MGHSTAKLAQVAERRTKAIAMRLAGADWQAIADTLGYSDRGAACKDVSRALEQNRKAEAEAVEALRHVTVLRYDRLQAAYWPKALKGDVKAAEVVLKCIAGRSKVQGTEAPTRVSIEAQQLGDEIAQLLNELAGRSDGQPD